MVCLSVVSKDSHDVEMRTAYKTISYSIAILVFLGFRKLRFRKTRMKLGFSQFCFSGVENLDNQM